MYEISRQKFSYKHFSNYESHVPANCRKFKNFVRKQTSLNLETVSSTESLQSAKVFSITSSVWIRCNEKYLITFNVDRHLHVNALITTEKSMSLVVFYKKNNTFSISFLYYILLSLISQYLNGLFDDYN